MQKIHADIVVVGAGLAGLTATLALLKNGFKTVNIAPLAARRDQRTTALWSDSIEFLKSLDADQVFQEHGSPIRTIRMIDATDRLIRSPQIEFHASEIELEEFGYNIGNHELSISLRRIINEINLEVFSEASVGEMSPAEDRTELTLDTGQKIVAGLVVGADGRNSGVRKASGISVRNWSYPQTAIVLNFKHSVPHDDVSTEFHTRAGPFTMVPLGKGLSSLVWVERPELAEQIKRSERADLESRIEQKMHSMLGKIEIVSDIQSFPLSGMIANSFGSGQTMLVGEAAHVFPPIGAQGLNLGIRDIKAVANLVKTDRPTDSLISEYNKMRRSDIESRTASVDLMNRSLLSDFLPIQMLRGMGMAALASIGPLRRTAMREGVAPGRSLRTITDSLANRLNKRKFG
ncbi:MAG: UbiH/UbiF family hydroxylase [Rhizobiaceae bacterium]